MQHIALMYIGHATPSINEKKKEVGTHWPTNRPRVVLVVLISPIEAYALLYSIIWLHIYIYMYIYINWVIKGE